MIKTDFCKSICSDAPSAAQHVDCGRAEMMRCCHTVMTQPWLDTACYTWAVAILLPERTGTWQVRGGCEAEEDSNNLVCTILQRLKLAAWIFHHLMMSNGKYSLLCGGKKCVWVSVCGLRTGSLEVDASHLHGVRWMMGHHLCITQKALGSGLWVLALAAQKPVNQKSN